MAQTTVKRVIDELQDPIRGHILAIRQRVANFESSESIDKELADLSHQIEKVVRLLWTGHHVGHADIPIEVVHGTTFLRPPLLQSASNGDGIALDQLLEQIISERTAVPDEHPREAALVVTKLEEALHWEQRLRVLKGSARIEMVDPPRV